LDPSAEALKIAFVSYANPQQVVEDIKPVVAYLERYVGVPVKGFVTLDYGSSVEAMRNGHADLAFVDPLAFMMAHEQIGVLPLLLEVYYGGQPTYHSNIWVRRDSDLTKLGELAGKTIAFADPVDMSGYLLPRDIFERKSLIDGVERPDGGFFSRVYFAGGDEQAMRAVFNGFVDAAGVSEYAYLLLRPEERDQIITIAQSIESPSHLVMVRHDLSEVLKRRIRKSLAALDISNPQDKQLLDKLYGVRGFVGAEFADFASVAPIAARYGFIKHPEKFVAAAGSK
jgi:phosphonate transport system substrate-binding protein